MKRKAVIDLGSNSFKLLVAEGDQKKFKKLHESKRFVALATFDGRADGTIERSSVQAIKELIHEAQQQDCHDIQLVATSFFRAEQNRKWLIALLKKHNINYPLKVISGEEEASLIAEGVLHEISDDHFLIMDIGGGSIEFISIFHREVQQVYSFDIGVRRWAEKYDAAEGITEKMNREIFAQLDHEVGKDLLRLKNHLLVGAAGSFETFYSVLEQKQYTPQRVSNYEVSIDVLWPHLNAIAHAGMEAREQHSFIESARVNFIPFAALITQYVIKMTEVQRLKLAANALKEGVLLRDF